MIEETASAPLEKITRLRRFRKSTSSEQRSIRSASLPSMLTIQKKYGKNAILKGLNLEEGATTIERNGQIGGHRK